MADYISQYRGEEIDALLGQIPDKVDKEEGKGLSTNDFTNAEKEKVDTSITDAPSDGKQYVRKDGSWVEIEGDGVDIIDNLTSERTDAALSAKQGKVLKGLVDGVAMGVTSIGERMTTAESDIDALENSVAGKYTKPSSGIPETDLSSGVQSSLLKANSALQDAPSDGKQYVRKDSSWVENEGGDLSKYAKKDGYYQQMGVGVADNLAGKGDGVPAVFTRRTTGGSASVADGVATLKSIKGKTIAWNQLVDVDSLSENTISGLTFTPESNGVIHIHGTSTGRAAYRISPTFQGRVGDKYYIRFQNVRDEHIRIDGGRNNQLGHTYTSEIKTCDGNYLEYLSIVAPNAYSFDFRCQPWACNLTQMFGAGNEPSTVEEFEALFPAEYYEYNAGQLLSFNGTDIVTDGFNQFDGTKARVIGGQTYYINGTYSILKFAKTIDGTQTDITPVSNLYTPAEDGYIFATGASATFCINLSWSGYRNGEYEPYWQETKQLPSIPADGLKSCGASASFVYDEITAEKSIIRVGSRAYQEGDESDTTLTTDGTTGKYNCTITK